MLIPLILLAVCCLVGAATFYWLWTIEDWHEARAIPWAQESELDFNEYPIHPGNDWNGLV